jgi:hypothetical protein
MRQVITVDEQFGAHRPLRICVDMCCQGQRFATWVALDDELFCRLLLSGDKLIRLGPFHCGREPGRADAGPAWWWNGTPAAMILAWAATPAIDDGLPSCRMAVGW